MNQEQSQRPTTLLRWSVILTSILGVLMIASFVELYIGLNTFLATISYQIFVVALVIIFFMFSMTAIMWKKWSLKWKRYLLVVSSIDLLIATWMLYESLAHSCF